MDYGKLFAMNLHGKLKEKIVGYIFVVVNQWDKLVIEIESFGGLEYRVVYDNFSSRILHGWTSDYAVYEIVQGYRKFIRQKFFV